MADDFHRLQPGELLVTDLPADALADVSIDGDIRVRARPASLNGSKAVVIEE